jgi:CRISPR/Cas system-associated endonuclease Cas3-HD
MSLEEGLQSDDIDICSVYLQILYKQVNEDTNKAIEILKPLGYNVQTGLDGKYYLSRPGWN